MLLIGALLILIPLLAFLQYHWIGQVGAAEHMRLQENLDAATRRFVEDLRNEFTRIAAVFQPGVSDSWTDPEDRLARSFDQWGRTTSYPELIERIFVTDFSTADEPQIMEFDLRSESLSAAEWPAGLEGLRDRGFPHPPRPGDIDSLQTGKLRLAIPVPTADTGREYLFEFPQSAMDWTIVELERDRVTEELLADLADRHFESTTYAVGIVEAQDRSTAIYLSDEHVSIRELELPDVAFELFAPSGGRPGRGGFGSPSRRRGRERGQQDPGDLSSAVLGTPGRRGGRGAPPAIMLGASWKLVAKHRSGSLENAVSEIRNRNLAISFGTLLLLGIAGSMIVIWAERVRSAGRLQMEFSAEVSHELRTPLAIIRSAAHNIENGVVVKPEEIQEYAGMIGEQGRRLSDMVDQVILFAQTESGRRNYSLEPVSIHDVVRLATGTLAPLLDDAHCQVRTLIDPDLPPVLADPTALALCVQNLLSNAVKYGRSEEGTSITIQAVRDDESDNVRLSIGDRGPGIDPDDLPHLFQPFYRGHKVPGETHGNGLGLRLVKRIIEGHQGRVTVSTENGQGSCFTLHIPKGATS
jgi:signal transduction histidine kinase